jgi:hypothetical protein
MKQSISIEIDQIYPSYDVFLYLLTNTNRNPKFILNHIVYGFSLLFMKVDRNQ